MAISSHSSGPPPVAIAAPPPFSPTLISVAAGDGVVFEGVELFGDESLLGVEAEYDDDGDDSLVGRGGLDGDAVGAAESERKGGRSCLKDMVGN